MLFFAIFYGLAGVPEVPKIQLHALDEDEGKIDCPSIAKGADAMHDKTVCGPLAE